MMAAYQVSTGVLTPGDFVMIQALFMQLSGPLFNMGGFFSRGIRTGKQAYLSRSSIRLIRGCPFSNNCHSINFYVL
jgi:ABC-type transport system involved in Fe-S cluster assembly fused permease/ATPase subunit